MTHIKAVRWYREDFREIREGTLKGNMAIFNKLNLDRSPLGIKFLYSKPEGLEKLEKKLRLCAMREAQRRGRPFYIDRENELLWEKVLGMESFPSFAESGQIGYELKIFQEPRLTPDFTSTLHY